MRKRLKKKLYKQWLKTPEAWLVVVDPAIGKDNCVLVMRRAKTVYERMKDAILKKRIKIPDFVWSVQQNPTSWPVRGIYNVET